MVREQACKVQSCYNKLHTNYSIYCQAHACHITNCKNSIYCDTHTCQIKFSYHGKCETPLIDGVRCPIHSCNIDNCAENKKNCMLHRCNRQNCYYPKFQGSDWCNFHTCDIDGCKDCVFKCPIHRCKMCTNLKADMGYVDGLCFAHKCLMGNCSQPKLDGMEYCHWHRQDYCIECGAPSIFSRDPERQRYGIKEYCKEHAPCVICKHKHRLYGQKTCGRHPKRVLQDSELDLPIQTPDSRELLTRRTCFVLSRRVEEPCMKDIFNSITELNKDMMIELTLFLR